MLIPSKQELQRTVLQALQANAPRTYLDLEQAGELEEYAQERAQAILEAFEETVAPDLMAIAKSDLPTLERVRKVESVQRQAWESLMSSWLPQPEPETTESEAES